MSQYFAQFPEHSPPHPITSHHPLTVDVIKTKSTMRSTKLFLANCSFTQAAQVSYLLCRNSLLRRSWVAKQLAVFLNLSGTFPNITGKRVDIIFDSSLPFISYSQPKSGFPSLEMPLLLVPLTNSHYHSLLGGLLLPCLEGHPALVAGLTISSLPLHSTLMWLSDLFY